MKAGRFPGRHCILPFHGVGLRCLWRGHRGKEKGSGDHHFNESCQVDGCSNVSAGRGTLVERLREIHRWGVECG